MQKKKSSRKIATVSVEKNLKSLLYWFYRVRRKIPDPKMTEKGVTPMSLKKKRIVLIFAVLVGCGVLLAGLLLLSRSLFERADPSDGGGSVSEATVTNLRESDSRNAVDFSGMDPKPSAVFTFSDSAISVSGNGQGYEINGCSLRIQASGTYRISGSCRNGSVTVTKGTKDVFLILDGVTLCCETSAPLCCNQESSVGIWLAEGTASRLSDTAENTENGVVKCKSGASVRIGGSGELSVIGAAGNGLKGGAEAVLCIDSALLTVSAQKNAVAFDHYIEINGGTLNLTAKNDALKAAPDAEDTVSAGNITVNGGSLFLDAEGDGISADGLLTLAGGSVSVHTSGTVTASSQNGFIFGGGRREAVLPSAESSSDISSKGIKAGCAMRITGGTLTVDSTDHAVHCGGECQILGGELTLSSSVKKGISVHGDLTVDGVDTQILIRQATEGIESKGTLTVNDGTLRILNASDDGLNAGSDSGDASASHKIVINGGYIYLYASGDGVDSNGGIQICGGTLIAIGPNSGGNSCLDSEAGIAYTGGTVLGIASSSSMWAQDVLGKIDGTYGYQITVGSVSAGDAVTVCASDGSVLISVPVPFSGSIGVVVLSDRSDSPDSWKAVLSGTVSGISNEDGVILDGTVSGGTSVALLNGSEVSGGGGMPGMGTRPGSGKPGFGEFPSDDGQTFPGGPNSRPGRP